MSKLVKWLLLRLAFAIASVVKEILESLLDRENGDPEDVILSRVATQFKRERGIATDSHAPT